MPIEITITNASGLHYRGKPQIEAAVSRTFKSQKINTARVDIVFLTDAEMKRLNNQYLQHNYTTDVLTFPLDSEPLHGEVYISLSVAKQQSEEYGVTLQNELCRLCVHGTLHLLGFDDATPAGRQRMTDLENRFIGAYER
ncbi:MAG: rRNA maturation RNase YbeY [Ignavibacteria bacterium]|nr:rRNA maturation RNase YbeY [Ignavibacteria bacterium]